MGERGSSGGGRVRVTVAGRLEVMVPFDELSEQGQVRRLRSLARTALVPYGAPSGAVRLRLAGRSFNTVFQVSWPGHRAALRVGPVQRIHAEDTEVVETNWARALREEGVAQPPEVIVTRTGAPIVRRQVPGVPGERVCTLFGWVQGKPLRQSMTVDRAHDMGQLAALLHAHAVGRAIGTDASVLVADRVLYWRLEDRLGELRTSGTLITEACDRATRVIDALWSNPPRPPHLLHGDLTPDNILVSRGNLVPIDFQDLVWGVDEHDLVISQMTLGGFDDAQELRHAFQRGYRSVRPWPDHDPDVWAALAAARRLHQLNLALTLRKPGLDLYVARAVALVAEWMSRRGRGFFSASQF